MAELKHRGTSPWRRWRRLLPLAAAALAVGCASQGEILSPSADAGVSETRAVVSLMQQSASLRGRGDLSGAVAALERALRLEPRNPKLWLALAQLRLAGDHARVAESLALKALSLAGGDPDTRRRAWALIAEARTRYGDSAGARQARDNAQSL